LIFGLIPLGVGAYALHYGGRGQFVDQEAFLHGSLIGGVGLLLVVAGLWKIANGAVALIVLVGVVAGVAFYMKTNYDDMYVAVIEMVEQRDIMGDLEPLCVDGVAIPEAAAYSREPGTHPTAMFTTSSSGTTYSMNAGDVEAWQPSSIEEAQLVACITTNRDVVETCEYTTSQGAAYIYRVQMQKSLELYEARTRTLVASASITGGMPPNCSDSVTFSEYEFSRDLSGGLPNERELIAEVRGFIEVGPDGPPTTAPPAPATPLPTPTPTPK